MSAGIRIEHVIREENMLAAYDLIVQFCELVVSRLPIIKSQKDCPLDLKEAISTLIFAAPRCADLQELQQVRDLFIAKYGKEFAVAAAELHPECGVNKQIIEKMSSRAPTEKMKLKMMKEIAAEHKVDWDAEKFELKLPEQPQDLLDGSAEVRVVSLEKEDTSVLESVNNSGMVSLEQARAAAAYVPSSPPSPARSSSTSGSHDASPPVRGKFPPPGKYDSPPRNGQVFQRKETDNVGKPMEVYCSDPFTRAKEDKMDHGDHGDLDSFAGLKDKDTTSSESSPAAQAQFELPLPELEIPTSLFFKKTSELDTYFRRESSSEYTDVASAAQAAFESAAHAALAARAAIHLAKNGTRESFHRDSIGSQSAEQLSSRMTTSSKKVVRSAKNNSSWVDSTPSDDNLDEGGDLIVTYNRAAKPSAQRQRSVHYSGASNEAKKCTETANELGQADTLSSPRREQIEIEQYASVTGNNGLPNSSKRSSVKPGPFREEGSADDEKWGFGRRIETRTNSTTKDKAGRERHAHEGKAHVGKIHFDDYLEPDEEIQGRGTQMKYRIPNQRYNHAQAPFNGSRGVVDGGRGNTSNLNKGSSKGPEVWSHGKLKWHSTDSEDAELSLQPGRVKSNESDDFLYVKRGYYDADKGKACKQGLNRGIQLQMKGENTEETLKGGVGLPQVGKTETPFDETPRFMRSVRTRQAKQPPPSREDTDHNSKFDDERNERRQQKIYPLDYSTQTPHSWGLKEPGRDAPMSPSDSDSSSMPSPPSKSTARFISPTTEVSRQQTPTSPNHSTEKSLSQREFELTDTSKVNAASGHAFHPKLPDYDDFAAQFEALKRKH